jgi:Ca-activated chloride channel homolog
MKFHYPQIIIFLILQIFIWIFVLLNKKRKTLIFPKSTKKIESNFKSNFNNQNIKWRNRFIIYGILSLGIASLGPQIGTKFRQIERKGVDIVIALDTSISMDSDDVSPSRIKKAKFELSKLINSLNGDRVAIIVFAGSSHLYLPLTSDYDAALLFLNQINTQMIPTKGTNLKSAFTTALSTFSYEKNMHKVLLLVSDGEDHEGEIIDLSKKASKNGFTINTVGVGSNLGSLIPIKNKKNQSTTFKRDKNGKLVTSVLNIQNLRDIAHAGNGDFFWFDNNRDTFEDILLKINNMEKKTISTHEYSDYENRYQLFALVSLLLLMIGLFMPTRLKIIN